MAVTPKAKGGAEKGIGRRGKKGMRVAHRPALTLAAQGIDKHLADRARKAAALPEHQRPDGGGIVSDDGAVRVTAREVEDFTEDLPSLRNVRGLVCVGLRIFARLPPQDRRRALGFFLLKKDREAAARAADRAERRMTTRGVYGDDSM
jgi:hypothetical protein